MWPIVGCCVTFSCGEINDFQENTQESRTDFALITLFQPDFLAFGAVEMLHRYVHEPIVVHFQRVNEIFADFPFAYVPVNNLSHTFSPNT